MLVKLRELEVLASVAGFGDVEVVHHQAGWDCWAARTLMGASSSLMGMGRSEGECIANAAKSFEEVANDIYTH